MCVYHASSPVAVLHYYHLDCCQTSVTGLYDNHRFQGSRSNTQVPRLTLEHTGSKAHARTHRFHGSRSNTQVPRLTLEHTGSMAHARTHRFQGSRSNTQVPRLTLEHTGSKAHARTHRFQGSRSNTQVPWLTLEHRSSVQYYCQKQWLPQTCGVLEKLKRLLQWTITAPTS